MAEEEKGKEKSGDHDATPKAKGGLNTILIILVAILLLSQGTTAYLLFKVPKGDEVATLPANAAADGASVPELAEDEALEEGERPLGAIFPMEPMVTNLSGGGFLRVQIQVEFLEREVPRKFLSRLVLVRDGVLAVIGAKTRTELMTSRGKDELREEVKSVIAAALHKEVVERVFFNQYLIY